MEKQEYIVSKCIFESFLNIFYKDAREKLSDEQIDVTHKAFTKYLYNLNNPELLEKIVPKSVAELVMYNEHPLYIHGFNPAFVFHFTEFVKSEQEKLSPEEIEYIELEEYINDSRNDIIPADKLKRFVQLKKQLNIKQ